MVELNINSSVVNSVALSSRIFCSSSNGNGFINPRNRKSGAKAIVTFVQSNARSSRFAVLAALHLSSLRFYKFRPHFPKAYINMLLELSSISHALCNNLFSCCFEQYHILFRSGNQEAVTFSETHKEFTIFK